MEEFEENMLATCLFYNEGRQEIIQLQTERINMINFCELDIYYEELKPLIDSISEFDFTNPISEGGKTWPFFEIKGPLTIVFLFRNTLIAYNSDGIENEKDTEFVYQFVIARIFDVAMTYYEPIGNDIHLWIKEKSTNE